MKPFRRIDGPPLRTTDPKADPAQPQERLVADKRAGLTPADLVEQRFQALLHGSSARPGAPRLGPSPTDGRSRRAIEYAPTGGPGEEDGRGGEALYAISIEQPQAAEILARLRPWPCRFWQTDHRGPLLIHAHTPRGARGPASPRGPGANALIGVVDLVDCVAAHPRQDPDEVEYHWLLANARTFARPLPYAGRSGLFLVSERVVLDALRQAGPSRRPRRR